MSMVELLDHQKLAVERLRSGSILCGGVGSGKSITALAFFLKNYPNHNLYIITTAKKRDKLEWDMELEKMGLGDIFYTVDSWNNIQKYKEVARAFFIFDEQHLVGSGVWVKSFLKISKLNEWLLLTATPGDTWMCYIPVFVANGFYKNRTEFIRRHVVYNPRTNFPKVDRYLDVDRLERLKQLVQVNMNFERFTKRHVETLISDYDKKAYHDILKKRWNPWLNRPIQNASELCSLLRRVVNSDADKMTKLRSILSRFEKVIIFYNFNYELDILRTLQTSGDVDGYAEYNGQKHETIPNTKSWVYIVQYAAGSEAWNCIETNAIVFYSPNYSYRTMEQSAGRIDRLNTPYEDLYYFCIRSVSTIDMAIFRCLEKKRDFNEKNFNG